MKQASEKKKRQIQLILRAFRHDSHNNKYRDAKVDAIQQIYKNTLSSNEIVQKTYFRQSMATTMIFSTK